MFLLLIKDNIKKNDYFEYVLSNWKPGRERYYHLCKIYKRESAEHTISYGGTAKEMWYTVPSFDKGIL